MEARLLTYRYKYTCQGTDEEGFGTALVYVPETASFALARSVLVNALYRKYDYEIILESVKDMTIHFTSKRSQ